MDSTQQLPPPEQQQEPEPEPAPASTSTSAQEQQLQAPVTSTTTTTTASATAASPAAISSPPFPLTALYVGDLDPNITDQHLLTHFRQFNVRTCRVCMHSQTQQSLGYAYANFDTHEDAAKAMAALNYSTIAPSTRPIRIMWSRRDPSFRKSGQGNICVTNLPGTVTSKTLYEMFKKFGEIWSCKVSTDAKGRSKGKGFVHFEKVEDAQKAIEAWNGKTVEGREISVCPFQRRTGAIPDALPEETRFTNLYVGHLDPSVNKQKLTEVFAPYGEVTSSVVILDPNGVSKGSGLVNFKEHQCAMKAMEELNKREIPGVSTKEGLYVTAHKPRGQLAAEFRKQLEQTSPTAQKQGLNLYVRNLTEGVTDKMLEQLFSEYGTVTSATVMRDSNGVSKGFGFVRFADENEGRSAVHKLNYHQFRGKPIYVALHQSREERKQALIQQFSYAPQRLLYPPPFMFAPIPQMQPRMPMGYNIPMVPQTWMPMRQPLARGQQPMQAYQTMPAGYQQPIRRMPQQQMQQGQQQRRTQVPHQKTYASVAKAPQEHPQQQAPLPQQVSVAPAQVPDDSEKQMIGERLYDFISRYTEFNPSYIGKLTGMLLASLDVAQLQSLLANPTTLSQKIQEAYGVLVEHLQRTSAP